MSESQRADIPRIETSKESIKMNVMKKEINPRETSRAEAFELWMSSPMPMVTMTTNFKNKQEERMEIQYDIVLGDRSCSIENQGVLSSS